MIVVSFDRPAVSKAIRTSGPDCGPHSSLPLKAQIVGVRDQI